MSYVISLHSTFPALHTAMAVVWLVLSLWLIATTKSDTTCDDYEECSSESSPATITDTRYIYCSGNKTKKNTCYHENITMIGIKYVGKLACSYATKIEADLTLYCSGSQGCYSSTLIDGGGTVKCTGSSACASSNSISPSGYLVCDGDRSCALAGELTTTSLTIYCEGKEACKGVTGNIHAQNSGSVECNGYYGCSGVDGYIKGLNVNVYGYYGADNTEILTNNLNGDIYISGEYGAYQSTVTAGDLIYCVSRYSCQGATLDAGNGIQISGEFAAEDASITSGGYIYCYGRRGCRDADLTADGTIWLTGVRAAEGSSSSSTKTITAPNVKAYGCYSAEYTNIDSGSLSTLTVEFYGYKAGYGADVTCQSGATCTIKCLGNG